MPDLYQIAAARPPEHLVGWRQGEAVRNDAFLGAADAWRRLLQAAPGRNYALYLEDSIEFGAALLGAWQAGKAIWLAADTLAATCATLARSVDGFLGEFPSDYTPLRGQVLPVAPGAANPRGQVLPVAPGAALVVHTSGSTGAAQAIPKRLDQLFSEVATLEAVFGAALGQAEIVATVSHQHIYGLLFKVLWPLTAGRPIHARSQNYPEELALLLAQRPCVLVASPAHLKRLPGHLDWRAAASLRAVFSSGGPLPADVAHGVGQMLGKVPFEIYGSSETGGIAWRQRGADADEAWTALPQVAWRIAAGAGELEVRSPHLPDDAWLRLADRAHAHADGRFMLGARSDRIVKIEEKRISLDAIEALLARSGLADAARVLVCDDGPGTRQRLAAFIVPSQAGRALLDGQGKRALNERLRLLLAGAVEAVALPRRWRYLEQMPIDAQGKTTQALLLALLDARPRQPQVRLLAREETRVELELVVPPELYYFDGHFPQAPILPGVVQVDWALAYGRQYFALAPEFRAMHALKFQHVILSNTPVTLELVHDLRKNSLNFRYFSAAGQHASGRILLDQAPPP